MNPPDRDAESGSSSSDETGAAGVAEESGEASSPAPDPLSEALAERDEYRDALVRLQAEFENYRKRMIKQQTENLERANESLVEKLLPVLDVAEMAAAHGAGEETQQLASALFSALEREGLERVSPDGEAFDPTLHEAVELEPGEDGAADGKQVVVAVLRSGYLWKRRVLRPAMVKVKG